MRRITFPGLAACGLFVVFLSSPLPAQEGKKGASEETGNLYKELDLFTKVLHSIQTDYVEEVATEELIEGAIRGMISAIDPHSSFMPPDQYRELKVDTEGKFSGVGIEITVKDNLLTVVSPIEGSPAARAGIREGDRIFRINGVSTKEMDLTDAVQKMRGNRKSRIVLTIQRDGIKEPFDVALTREIIHVKSVRAQEMEPGYSYVRISSFQEETTEELEKALGNLEKSPEGIKGVALDLRNNPGGLLDEAVEVADKFLTSGVIVTTVSRNQEVDRREAHLEGTHPDYPMIVLVNGGSASASEIVAGALQDHDRAVILGTQTFGKGSVQSIVELGDGSALKLTVARYFTPMGRSIQAEGISPDIVVDSKQDAAVVTLRERAVREKDLPGHLEAKKEPAKKGQPPPIFEDDPQLKVALDYLKSWEVFRK